MGPFGNEALGIAALVSFVLTFILFVFDLVPVWSGDDSSKLGRRMIGSSITAVCVFLNLLWLNFLVFFFWQPALVGPWGGWIWITFEVAIALAAFWVLNLIQKRVSAGVVLGTVLMLVWVIGACGQAVFTPASDGGAKNLAGRVVIEQMPDGLYPETDANHIIQVPEEAARFKARQIIAEAKDESGRNLSTVYQVHHPALQSVNGHLYWIFELGFSGWRVSNQVDRIVPGYIVVDAEDPQARPDVRLGYKMKYTYGSPLNTSLHRLIYNSGYRHWFVDDITLEVRDDWKPFYTASLNKPAMRFKGSVPEAMIMIDPETGNIERYGLDEIPEWVDRVYSKHVVTDLLEWWGHWANAPWKFINETATDRMEPASEPVLVYTKGGHPAWQVLMTSWNNDTSATGIMLFDGRSNKARFYDVPGIAIESSAKKAFLSSEENLKNFIPVHLSLHRIYGELTWVAGYISEDTNADGAEPFQALGLLSAFNVDGANVIQAQSKAEALSRYRQLIIQGKQNTAPQEGSLVKTVEGIASRVESVVSKGDTYYLILLDSDPAHVFRGPALGNIELPFVKVGAHVVITYLDVGEVQVDIGSYDDIDMNFNLKP